jgi:hypothetical protein
MKFSKRTLIVTGVLMTAAATPFLVPNAAHAVIATLVQVVNTTANPVPTTDVSRSAAQNVELTCSFPAGGILAGLGCGQISSTCTMLSPSCPQYTVPSGENLVLTTISITASGSTSALIGLIPYNPATTADYISEEFSVPAGTTAQLQFPVSGVVIGPGLQPTLAIQPGGTFTTTGGTALLVGYLTPN